MSLLFRITGWLPWIVSAFFIAGIVHLASIFAMPTLAGRDAFARLAGATPLNRLVVLDNGAAGEELLPFEDPATVIGVCRFDLAAGPLRLRADLDGDGLSLMSFRTRFGAAFYAMNDRGTSHGRLDVIVATRAQLDAIEEQDSEDEVPSELRLLAPSNEGFVMLRVLALEPGQAALARSRLKAVNCHTEAVPGS